MEYPTGAGKRSRWDVSSVERVYEISFYQTNIKREFYYNIDNPKDYISEIFFRLWRRPYHK